MTGTQHPLRMLLKWRSGNDNWIEFQHMRHVHACRLHVQPGTMAAAALTAVVVIPANTTGSIGHFARPRLVSRRFRNPEWALSKRMSVMASLCFGTHPPSAVARGGTALPKNPPTPLTPNLLTNRA